MGAYYYLLEIHKVGGLKKYFVVMASISCSKFFFLISIFTAFEITYSFTKKLLPTTIEATNGSNHFNKRLPALKGMRLHADKWMLLDYSVLSTLLDIEIALSNHNTYWRAVAVVFGIGNNDAVNGSLFYTLYILKDYNALLLEEERYKENVLKK